MVGITSPRDRPPAYGSAGSLEDVSTERGDSGAVQTSGRSTNNREGNVLGGDEQGKVQAHTDKERLEALLGW
jgi:hypothetical protein